jgi:ribosomal protein S18 acetylase RimI-like enzyme
MTPIQYRAAQPSDAAPIGRLHADSWRRHYRGAYSDDYLDGDVGEERTVVWTERLSHPGADHYTIVAERDGLILGFAHTRLDEDLTWGALLDNLHVSFELKRQGVGRVLMAETALVLGQRRPTGGLYLWVLKQNTAAQAFYSAQGVCRRDNSRTIPRRGDSAVAEVCLERPVEAAGEAASYVTPTIRGRSGWARACS